ncbi:MAG: hydroxyacid dehydrogenase [Bacteroidetes bacterium]|nr:hydroxyacid dehydrogenase [Bacteroidota bacterium]
MLKINFYEVTTTDKRFLTKALKGKFQLGFFPDPLTDKNVATAKGADLISVFIYSVLDKANLLKLPKLKCVATRSTGFNHIDLKYAVEKNVTICNVPYYGENTVAEHTFGLILTLSRNIHKAYVRTIRNNFSPEGLEGWDIKGKTLGVVGAGGIGSHVIKIAKGFGMNVLAFDVHKNHFMEEVLGFRYVQLDELLRKSDIITLHCPYNKETHHLINMSNIGLVKKGALFINTARASIIEPEALHYALEAGIFGGAGLDVFEGEDLVKEENQMLTRNVSVEHLKAVLEKNILLNRENVIVTPHIAFDSVEAVERILQTTVDNIVAYSTGSPANVVK